MKSGNRESGKAQTGNAVARLSKAEAKDKIADLLDDACTEQAAFGHVRFQRICKEIDAIIDAIDVTSPV